MTATMGIQTHRVSARKSHPEFRQGAGFEPESERCIPQKRKHVYGSGETGPRYRSSEKDESCSYHRSWCGVSDGGKTNDVKDGRPDRRADFVVHIAALFSTQPQPFEPGDSTVRPHKRDGILESPSQLRHASPAANEGYPAAGSGRSEARKQDSPPSLTQSTPQVSPKLVSSATCPVMEEVLPTFSPEIGSAVRLPGSHYPKHPKESPNRHQRQSVYEIYFGDDFGPDFEAAQVPSQLSFDVDSE